MDVTAERARLVDEIAAGRIPGVELVDAHVDHNAEHGENPELIDEGDER